ncbi:hypothetical protein GeomeDRAFT_1574 [Geobacter metallireducens RCH3]|uniref:Lipoprotein, putative n=1 Tax=Geobacter metallireducens (strain ATCC 53774 / DSM 7210 / GS-15) TaxID=269799 RepID=Q39U49_GEOMG|nr:hypothetical protein [Geobacter metallireducens]ABB32225.1 lipoprotein, putative [Geobacter metallireducens GS-15]EHP87007.1 hypothetical protein GeomeDRAFT_1574 [Geobacter metallireducens RCH3]
MKRNVGTGFCAVGTLCAILVLLFSGVSGCSRTGVHIVSYQLRDRVITLRQPQMRSSLIVGFKVDAGGILYDRLTVQGELRRDGVPLGRDTICRLDGPTGSFGFDIPHQADLLDPERPYSIPDGIYSVQIRVMDPGGHVVADLLHEFRRNQLGRRFVAKGYEYKPFRCVADQPLAGSHSIRSVSARVDTDDGILFAHSPQERVFSDSVPGKGSVDNGVSICLARGETQAVAVSLRGKRDLGVVSLEVTPLRSVSGSILSGAVLCGVVKDLNEVVREDAEQTALQVRRAPRLIEQGAVTVGHDETRSFWITVAIPVGAVSGIYRGALMVRNHAGTVAELPLTVEVLPLTLPDPDIRYGMMMDYAFYELDNPGWSAEERRTLVKRGEEIYRDFRAHGMNVAYPHSHFFYRTDDKGQPVLEGLKAALGSYRSQGFSGPFVWYLGHLLHTAKPQHPGSILLYDEEVAVRRLRALLSELERLCRERGIAKERVLIQVVDEPDRRDQVRTNVGETLHRIVREMGFRTLITRPWPQVDVICTGDPDDDAEADRLRKTAHEWWIYPNGALTGQNLSYTRYVFGFGAWRWGVNGVVPWTYQMSQGSNGNPFTVLDGPEVMVAYPGAAGPISTPVWETIRDGINDYRYILALRELINRAKSRGDGRGVHVERELERIRASLGAGPSAAEGSYGAWPPGSFDEVRGRIIALIRELR